jgi:hypothetical protein
MLVQQEQQVLKEQLDQLVQQGPLAQLDQQVYQEQMEIPMQQHLQAL